MLQSRLDYVKCSIKVVCLVLVLVTSVHPSHVSVILRPEGTSAEAIGGEFSFFSSTGDLL